jgi:predicted RND superfamily exporter protein
VAFDVSGATIVAIGVGIGADYAIYCLFRLREEFWKAGDFDTALHVTLATSGRAVAFVALAISAGFGVYLTSDFYSFRVFGTFVPLTMLTSCVTALALPAALVVLLRPRFIFGAEHAGTRAHRGHVARPAA